MNSQEEVQDRRVRQQLWVQRITVLLDTRFRIPFTRIDFGYDAILGLLPVLGDLVSAIVSALLIIAYARLGISTPVLIRMIGNLLLDLVVGSIPVLGTVFDVAFKANKRNMRLAEKHLPPQ